MIDINNLDDVFNYIDYLKTKKIDTPRGSLISIPLEKKIFDKIASQLWNRGYTYTNLHLYTEITLRLKGIKVQIKLHNYYNDSITQLKQDYDE